MPLRIIPYGVEWEDELLEGATDSEKRRRFRLDKYLKSEELLRSIQESAGGPDKDRRLQSAMRTVEGYRDMRGVQPIPEPSPEMWTMAQEYLQRPDIGFNIPAAIPEDWKKNTCMRIKKKHGSLLRFKHPEPGQHFLTTSGSPVRIMAEQL